MLDWQSNSDDFGRAPEDDIREIFEIAAGSGRVRRIAEKFLAKKCIFREFQNQAFAWETLNGASLRVPRPIRYVGGSVEGENGIMIMEYLDGHSWDTAENVDESLTNERVRKAVQHMHTATPKATSQPVVPGPLDGGLAESFPWGRGQKEVEHAFASIQDVEMCANKRLTQYAKTYKHRKTRNFNLRGQRLAICHGDLAPRNILILADGHVALLDWEYMCLYPLIFEVACLSMLDIDHPHKKQKWLIENLKAEARLERQGEDIEEDIKTLRIVDRVSLRYDFPKSCST